MDCGLSIKGSKDNSKYKRTHIVFDFWVWIVLLIICSFIYMPFHDFIFKQLNNILLCECAAFLVFIYLLYCRAIVIKKNTWYWYRDRQVDQGKRIENPENTYLL